MEIAVIYRGTEIIFSETVISSIILAIFLIIVAFVVNCKIKKAKVEEAPKGLLNVIEILVETIDNMVKDNMGEKNKVFAPFIMTLITFITASNLSGLFGLTPPTSDYSVTLTLGLIVFIIVQTTHIRSKGFGRYFKSFTEPYILMTPINIISEISNPISMSFRLFGNILSGTLITTLLYGTLGYFAPLASPIHVYFDIFVGILQAFVFSMLAMVFINSATS